MASYKKLYEAALEEARTLQAQVSQLKLSLAENEKERHNLVSLDEMVGELSDSEAKDFVLHFADRCENRAEVNLLIRVANKLGA